MSSTTTRSARSPAPPPARRNPPRPAPAAPKARKTPARHHASQSANATPNQTPCDAPPPKRQNRQVKRQEEGRFSSHHALMCRLHLDHIAHLEQMIARLDAQIETMMQPYRTEQDLLATIPGIRQLAAAAIISEISADVRAYFPSAAHLASWAGICPGNHESAGKQRSGKRRHGNQNLEPVLAEAAWSAARHQGYLQSLYHRHVMKSGGYRSTSAKKQGHHHRRPRHPRHRLARPGHRHPLPRTWRRLLGPPPGPRTRNPPPHRQTRSPRTPGHPGRRRLTHPAREADGTNRRRLLTRAWLETIHVSEACRPGAGPPGKGR